MKNPCFPLALISQIGYTVFCKLVKQEGLLWHRQGSAVRTLEANGYSLRQKRKRERKNMVLGWYSILCW